HACRGGGVPQEAGAGVPWALTGARAGAPVLAGGAVRAAGAVRAGEPATLPQAAKVRAEPAARDSRAGPDIMTTASLVGLRALRRGRHGMITSGRMPVSVADLRIAAWMCP